jgi:hypothetical protein
MIKYERNTVKYGLWSPAGVVNRNSFIYLLQQTGLCFHRQQLSISEIFPSAGR